MARARNIKPGFFTNAELAELPFEARLLFEGLWCVADKEGRLRDRPKQIKGEIFPHDDVDVTALLDLLAGAEEPFVQRYEVDGKQYLQVVNWNEHQSPHHTEKESTIPPPSVSSPLTNGYGTETREVNAQREQSQESGIRNQESVSEGGCKGETKSPPATPPDAPGLPPELAQHVRLSKAVDDWLRYKGERREGYKPTGLKAFYGRVTSVASTEGPRSVISRMERAMASGWKGWEHDTSGGSRGSPSKAPMPTGASHIYDPTQETRDAI